MKDVELLLLFISRGVQPRAHTWEQKQDENHEQGHEQARAQCFVRMSKRSFVPRRNDD